MGSKNEHQMLGFKIMYNNNNSNKKAFWYWLSLESCLNKIYLEDDRSLFSEQYRMAYHTEYVSKFNWNSVDIVQNKLCVFLYIQNLYKWVYLYIALVAE